jgi:hypothetical protein
MSKFPCRDCLVRAICSEHCDILEKNHRIITVYINSSICIDCGSSDLITNNKMLVVCRSCKKAFEKVAEVKDSLHKIQSNVAISQIFPKNSGHIIKPGDLEFPVPTMTMEETHDLLYRRATSYLTRYALEMIDEEIKKRMNKIPSPKKKERFSIPDRFQKYPNIISKDEPDQMKPIPFPFP